MKRRKRDESFLFSKSSRASKRVKLNHRESRSKFKSNSFSKNTEFSKIRKLLSKNNEFTPQEKNQLKTYPYRLCSADQQKQFLNRIIVLLRRELLKTRDLVGQDHKLRKDILNLILNDHRVPYTRAFIWYCFHKPRKEFNDLVDAIIKYRSRASSKTTLITCGVAAFQHWILNASSKTRLTNPFDLGLIGTDSVIHSSERSLSLLRWVWWQTQSKTFTENIERCLDFGLEPLPNDFQHIPHMSKVKTTSGEKQLYLANLLQEGYNREKKRQKTIHEAFLTLKHPKIIPQIVVAFVSLQSYYFNFARNVNVVIH